MLVAEIARTRIDADVLAEPRVSPSVLNSRYTGTSRSWSGIIRVASTIEEQDLAAREAEPGEGVAGDAAEHQVGDRHADGDDRAVDEQPGSGGSSFVEGVLARPSSVNGSGMNVSRTESGSVLNDVITDQANGTNIRSA